MEQENGSSDDHDQLIISRSFFCSYTSYLLSALMSLKDSRLTLMPAAAANCEEEGRAAASVNIDDRDELLQEKDHEFRIINTTTADHNNYIMKVRHEVDMALVVAATKLGSSPSSKWCRSLKWKLDHRHDYYNDQMNSSSVVLQMNNNINHDHHHYSSLLFHGLSIIPPHPAYNLFQNLINYYPTPTNHDQPSARSSCDLIRATPAAGRQQQLNLNSSSSSSFSTSSTNSSSNSSSSPLMLYWRRRRRKRRRFPKIRNGSKIRRIRRPAAKSVFKLKRRSNKQQQLEMINGRDQQQQQQLMYNYGKQLRVLRSLIPGGAEMKTDELFFELHNYVGHLKMQVTVLAYLVSCPPPPPPQPQLPPDHPAAATLQLM